jgi:hypothetical protein
MSLLLKALAVPHERKIELTPGQQELVGLDPQPWSAGCCTPTGAGC